MKQIIEHEHGGSDEGFVADVSSMEWCDYDTDGEDMHPNVSKILVACQLR